jgi:putative peptidoglycan lipid II flippase
LTKPRSGNPKRRPPSPSGFSRDLRVVSLATAFSRVTGYLRDMLNANLLGAGWISDAYFSASRIPVFMQTLLADGVLSQAFVPTFSKILEKKKKAEALEFMAQMFTLVILLAGGLTLLGMVFSPEIVLATSFGFSSQPEKFQLATRLTRLLFPLFLLSSLASLWMGTLNSLQRFAVPAFSTVAMNAVLIPLGLGFLAWKALGHSLDPLLLVYIWSAACLPGMFLQWAVQWPEAARQGFRPRLAWPTHPAILGALRLMAFALVSQSVYQVNLLVNQFFASFLPNGSVTCLYYGSRLFQLPFGVLGVSIATVAFPLLARQDGRGRPDEFNQTLTRSLGSGLYFTLPATVGLILVAEPLCRLAFQHGAFSSEATRWTAKATILYMISLVSNTGSKILMTAYYAKHRPRWTVISSFYAFLSNLLINGGLFIFTQNPETRFNGLALSGFFSSMVNLLILLWGLPSVGAKLDGPLLSREFLRITGASIVMGLGVWCLVQGLGSLNLPFPDLWVTVIPVTLGAGGYFWMVKKLGVVSGRMDKNAEKPI